MEVGAGILPQRSVIQHRRFLAPKAKLDMSVAFVREPCEVPVISRLRRIYSRLFRI